MKNLFYVLLIFELCFIFGSADSANAAASRFVATLTSLNPSQGAPGDIIQVDGMSYYSGSKIIFYDATNEIKKKTISASPIGKLPKGVYVPPGLKPTWMEFKFKVPSLDSGTYQVKLECSKGWPSAPLYFTILPPPPVVTGVSPQKGRDTTRFVVKGKNFGSANFIKLIAQSGQIMETGAMMDVLPYDSNSKQLIFYPYLLAGGSGIPAGKYKLEAYVFYNNSWTQARQKKDIYFTIK